MRSKDEVKNIVENIGYIFLDEYMDERKYRRVLISDSIGYKYDINLYSLMKNESPGFVGSFNPFSLDNISLWLKINCKDFDIISDSYVNNSEKLLFKCLNDNCLEFFDATWGEIYKGAGCPFCSGRRVGEHNNLEYLRPDICSEWNYIKNKVLPKEYVEKSGKKVWWICSDCGFEWLEKIIARTADNSRCPRCKRTKGEKSITKTLTELGFVSGDNLFFQKTFSDCREKYPLRFDFYIVDYNLCIEYHGEQHYKPVRFSYSISEKQSFENLKNQKARDKTKEKYCRDNDISLLVIPYWDYDNIEGILKETLEELERS